MVGAAAAVVPLWYLADRATSQGWSEVADELWQRRTLDLVVRSLALAGVVTALCVVIGVAAAWLVARADLPGRRVWQVALALPLAIPSYVSAFAWVSWKPWLAGFRGAVLVLVLASYPYVYLPVLAALRRLDPAHEEVARSLGWTPRKVVLLLTLRQVRPAIVAGALLVALYVLSDFGAVATMRFEAFTWVIYGAYRAGFNPAQAAILGTVLVAVAVVIVALEAHVRGSASFTRLGAGAPRPSRPLPLGRWRVAAVAFLVVVLAAAIAFPVAQVVHWMRRGADTGFDVARVASAVGATLRLSALAALAALAVAVPIGVLAARFRQRYVHVLERSTYVAHGLPGIVIAISLVFVGVRLLRPIYQETPLLVLAYVVLFLPLAVGTVRSSVEQLPVGLEEVARSLGHSPARVLARVTVPLAAPGLAAGAALVFLATMKELPATLLLRPTGTETLATELWKATSISDYAAAGPYALAIILLAAVPTALLSGLLTARADGPGDALP